MKPSLLLFCLLAGSAHAYGAGCAREGVAGPWQGDAAVRLTSGTVITGTFADRFDVTETSLTGHMRFLSLGPVALPSLLTSAFTESYTVTFKDGGKIDFASNWGTGGGHWGETEYAMTFVDKSGGARVEEAGTITDCDHMTVDAAVFELGLPMGKMHAVYTRPAL